MPRTGGRGWEGKGREDDAIFSRLMQMWMTNIRDDVIDLSDGVTQRGAPDARRLNMVTRQ